jgi:hypothetical protein
VLVEKFGRRGKQDAAPDQHATSVLVRHRMPRLWPFWKNPIAGDGHSDGGEVSMRFMWVLLMGLWVGTILGGIFLPGDLWMLVVGVILLVATGVVGVVKWEEMGRPR